MSALISPITTSVLRRFVPLSGLMPESPISWPSTLVRSLLMALALATLPNTSFAAPLAANDNIELRADHPNQYIVVKGDTLWSIAKRFLSNPWQWKSVWSNNPAIKDPNLIYPGDIVGLSMVNGRPALSIAKRGRKVIKLSPGVRAQALNEAVTTFPVDSIRHFLSKTRVIDASQRSSAPYLMGAVGERLMLGSVNERAYVRGITDPKVRRYGLYDVGEAYLDPDKEKDNILGLEAVYLGSVRIEKPGDPTIVRIEDARRELTEGALLLPLKTEGNQWSFAPHPVSATQEAKIIAVVDGVTQVAQFNVIAINAGSNAGIEPGHVFMGIEDQGTIEDPEAKRQISKLSSGFLDFLNFGDDEATKTANQKAKDSGLMASRMSKTVKLPPEPAGTVMVFQVFEKMSFALVMETRKPLEIGDRLIRPTPGF